MSEADLAWLAGLLEGEAWFGLNNQGTPSARLVLIMCDRDVVERAAHLMDTHVRGPFRATRSTRDLWEAKLSGEKALQLMQLLLPHMGERRQAKIAEILDGEPIREAMRRENMRSRRKENLLV